ncbi:hypothetical protein ACN2MM_02465 [Alkalilimnicola ehrlichii MLHE-1]|uniref:hypothetical protein n=1 Tax=Alkalilimnicola ehrlichii TaxID=351052 RepID=UPI0012EAEE04|nr:hypothetical protein [Alkalilimnicola ehrlichii]
MSGLVETFNMTCQDVALLWTCPVIAGAASLVRGWTSELDLVKPPVYETLSPDEEDRKPKQTSENKRQRSYWVVGMLLAGAGIGLGLALLFLGAIQPTSSAVGRVWLLALVLGYSTPIVLKQIDGKVEKAIAEVDKI